MNTKTRVRHSRAAFTLIELLVVVSVIALLLAILLPSLSMAHESGNMTVCGTQMNQLYNASFLYATENEDRIPYFAWKDGRTPLVEWWPTQVAQSMDNFEAEVYKCPSDEDPHNNATVYLAGSSISMQRPPAVTTGKGKNRVTRPAGRSVQLPITYRGSCDMVEETRPGSGQYNARKLSSWVRPTDALMMIEARANFDIASGDRECFRFKDHLGVLASGTRSHLNQQDWERHLGQSNYLFIDGHVQTLLPHDAGQLANNQEHYLP